MRKVRIENHMVKEAGEDLILINRETEAMIYYNRMLELILNNQFKEVNDLLTPSRMVNFCGIRDDTGANLIHYTILQYDGKNQDALRTIKLLVVGGLDINAKDINGSTPAHIMTELETIEKIVEYMRKKRIKFNIDINIQDNKGKRPINLAKDNKTILFLMGM